MKQHDAQPPFLAYTGYLTVGLVWIALIGFFLLDTSFFLQFRPLSYFATRPNTRSMYTASFVMAAIFLWVFMTFWVRRFLRVPVGLFTISCVAFIGVAAIPFHPEDIRNLVQHENITTLFAAALILGIFFVGYLNKNAALKKLSYLCAGVGFVASFIVWQSDGSSKLIVFLEIFNALLAQTWIIWLSRELLNPKSDGHKETSRLSA